MTIHENTKAAILVHLESITGALSIEHFLEVLPHGTPRSTIGRALRRLWAENKVVRERIVGDPKSRKMWGAAGKGPFTLVSPVPGVIPKPPKLPKVKKPKLPQVNSILNPPPPPAFSSVGTNTGRLSSTGPNLANAPKSAAGQICFLDIGGAAWHFVLVAISHSRTFSAYDITKEIREAVDTDKILINSIANTVRVGGRMVQQIVHDDVRDAVHKLFFDKKMVGYDRRDNGTYQEYYPVTPSLSAPGGQPTVADVTAYDGSPSL